MPPQLPLSGRRILLVEDEYFIAQDTRRAIEAAGGRIAGPYGQLGDALESVARDAADAAVIDIKLHRQMAYPLADALDARGVPYLFATGYDRTVVPERFARVPLLQKPFNELHLVRLLTGLCSP